MAHSETGAEHKRDGEYTAMKDLQIIPAEEGEVNFFPRGESEDIGLMLLQRLYVLIFSDPSRGYRQGDGGFTLWNFMQGGNIPTKDVFDSILATCCASALSMLDESDRKLVSSFTGEGYEDGSAAFTLTLQNGTTVKGKLTND